jgi:hypothetical protein
MKRSRPLVVLALVMATLPLSNVTTAAAEAPDICAAALERYALAPDTRDVWPRSASALDDGSDPLAALSAIDGQSVRIARSNGSDPTLVLDFGQVVSGRLIVETSGATSHEARLAVSESARFLNRESDAALATHHTYAWLPLSSGADALETGEVTLRYAMLFLAADGWVDIDAVHLRFTPMLGTPDTYAGCFESSDDSLNRIWYAGSYTLELNTIESDDGEQLIVDGAKRDRALWVADLALQARIEYLTHNRPEPIRLALRRLADLQQPDGAIPASSEQRYRHVFYDYCAWWVQALADYVRYTGDLAFAESMYPRLARQMDWFASKTGAHGLLVREEGLEWAYTLRRAGEVSYLNAVYYRALHDAADIARWLGRAAAAADWIARGEVVKQAMNARLFDPTRGVYIDSDRDSGHVPQDANVLAILYGIAPPERVAAILDYLQTHMWTAYGSTTVDVPYGLNSWHDKRIWPFMGYHELAARFLANDESGALDLLRREWGHMLTSDPASSIWEWLTAEGQIEHGFASLAHGWSGGATVALTEHVLGVRLSAPDYASFEVRPHPGDLTWARGRVPTRHGPIDAAWFRMADAFALTVIVPEGTRARVAVPITNDTTVVLVDGLPAWENGVGGRYDAAREGSRVYVELPPGAYSLLAAANWTMYPETGHVLGTVFQSYWDRHGGLPVFGYPLGEQLTEFNPDLRALLPAQYFERQRFEFHPEYAGTPYEVLLGRLGVADADRRGIANSPPFQPAGESLDSGCIHFAETGHNVCDRFLEYWAGHGLELGDDGFSFRESLALFGYPISESFTDPDSGRIVQYFERARFEWHPENAGTPYDVLLGRLGAELLLDRQNARQ